jgi:preprotein translocase subunit SecD
MTRLWRAVAVATCACLALWVAACGGGNATSTGSPTPQSSTRLSFLDIPGASVSVTPTPTPAPTRSGRAVVQADLSSGASPQTTIEKLEQVIQDRLGDAGVHSNISQTSDAELAIDFTGARSTDFVKEVIEAQNLNFRQPIIQANGDVTCKTNRGVEFSAPAPDVHETADNAGTRIDSCTTTDGQTGTMEWIPAQAGVNGETKTLTQSMIDPSQAEIKSIRAEGTVLLIAFDPEGTGVFAAVTAYLVLHYPLGIFLGDALLTAPTVATQVTSGGVQITGAGDDDLAAAKAVLKGGELPVPVSVTSIAPGSPTPVAGLRFCPLSVL